MNTDYIERTIKNDYSVKRREHTYGVRDTAVRLAEKYGADPEKARVCSLYHDLYRRASDELIGEYIEKYGLDPKYMGDPNLAHGKMAALFMEHEMGIKDPDMLNAVAYHTTGRAGMSVLEKVIYLADAIEPGRDYPSVYRIREMAENSLDRACLMILEEFPEYLAKKGRKMDPDSIKARDQLRKEIMDNREIANEAAALLDKKKAQDVLMIDISGKSSFSDYLVIASAGSERQTESLSDDVEDLMAKLGVEERAVEGKKNTGWVLLDYGDVIINIFSLEMREKYDLEKVWGDCESFRVETEE